MKRPLHFLALAVLAASAASAACAAGASAQGVDEGTTAPGPSWKFSGFGTLGAVRANTDDGQFRSSARQTHGADKSPSLDVDSRLGLQESVQLNPTVSAVGQLLASQRDGGDQPRVEWLFGQAHAAEWLDLRAGRMVLPVFLASDTRNVGYANHWARAPGEVYLQYPATSFDGLQALLRTEAGDTRLSAQASAGHTDVNTLLYGYSMRLESKQVYSLNLVAEHGNWTIRFGDTEARNTHLTTPIALFEPYDDSFRGIGLAYDNGRLLVQGEVVMRRTSGGGLIDMNGYYATVAYRFGAWTPYAIASRYELKGAILPPQSGRHTLAVGVRWDAIKDVAFKLQVESAQNDGLNFVNASPAFNFGESKVNVVTLLADFVF